MSQKKIDSRSLDRARVLLNVGQGEGKTRVLDELLRDARTGDGGQAFFELLVAANGRGPDVVGDKLPELLETAFRVVRDSSRPDDERAEAMVTLSRFHLLRPLPALDIAAATELAFLAATGLLDDVGKRLARSGAHLLLEWDMACLLDGVPAADDPALRRNVRPEYDRLAPACRNWLGRLRDEKADDEERAAAGVLLLTVRWPRLEMGLELEELVAGLAPALGRKHEALAEIWTRVRPRIRRRRQVLTRLREIDIPSNLPDARSIVDNPGRPSKGRIRKAVVREDSGGYSQLLPEAAPSAMVQQAAFAGE